MKRQTIFKEVLFWVTVVVNIVLSISVFGLMNHMQSLLNSDVEINLTEIVTQNKNVISSKLMLEVNNLHTLSQRMGLSLEGKDGVTEADLRQLLKDFPEEQGDSKSLFVADVNGIGYASDGRVADIAGRRYFRLALEGRQNISDKLISRLDGEDVFIISVPLYQNGIIVGTVQRSYTHDEMYALCSISLFSSKGYMYIINSEGYCMLHSTHENCYQKSDNYYRDLYEQGNQKSAQQMLDDLNQGKEGFIETSIGGQTIFSAYTPIEEIHDWYLITSVPTSAVSPNGRQVILLSYGILIAVVFIFTSCLFYFVFYKNKQKNALERIAFVDPITQGNTFNKFLVESQLLIQGNPNIEFAILKFDIDNFKYINSFYGFAYGDRLLQLLYRQVSNKLHSYEMLSRLSGDNFVALIEQSPVERLRDLLSVIQTEGQISIYFSAGVYPITNRDEEINLMVDKASTAARTVKGVLTQQIGFYSEKFDDNNFYNEQLKRNVDKALEDGEFEPFYQPKVDIETKKLVGAEALVRWRKQDGSLVSPGIFIPMCEKTGLVEKVDFLILERVLQFLRAQLDSEVTCVPISVNFSRLHLLNSTFMTRVVNLVDHYQIPPHLVEIEVTESAIFDNLESIYTFTENLHRHGFSIAMDDFGSGYSSLNMLKDIPIDTLKIDRGFLLESRDERRRSIIFSSVVEMANRLGIEVVVEGVETQENVDLMKQCGCTIAQGYFFAKPMEESRFDAVMKEGFVC